MSERTINNPRKRVFRPRVTGRLGNLLFEYVFWVLMSIQHRVKFENTFEKFPEPFDNVAKTVLLEHKYDVGLDYDEEIPDYPMDFKFYSNNRNLVKEILRAPTIEHKKYDVVVHVRLDDVFTEDEPLYTVLPLSYYKQVFNNIKKIHGSLKSKKILVIGRPLDDIQKKIFNDVSEYIEKITSANISRQNGTMTQDMLAIMSSPIIVGGTSSFWVFPSYTSNITNEVHVPDFGQVTLYNFFRNLGPNDILEKKNNILIRTNNETPRGDKFTIYGYKLPIKRKIEIYELHKIYDV